MVLAVEQHAAGPMPLENDQSTASEDTSYHMVDGEDVVMKKSNPTAGYQAEEDTEQGPPPTPNGRFLNEIQQLRQKQGQLRAENISLDMKAMQLERDNEDLRVELSRVRMALAKEKAESAKRKKKYDELLEDVSDSSDKLSKKLVKYKRRGDELETQLKEELAAQKVFWQEINQQLHKENELSLKEINELNEALNTEKGSRSQEKQEAKNVISTLEDKLEDALQDAAEMQIQVERVKVENAKLRKEKTEMSTNYEERISKLGNHRSSAAPNPEDEFSTEDMLRMMQETLGVEEVDDYE